MNDKNVGKLLAGILALFVFLSVIWAAISLGRIASYMETMTKSLVLLEVKMSYNKEKK